LSRLAGIECFELVFFLQGTWEAPFMDLNFAVSVRPGAFLLGLVCATTTALSARGGFDSFSVGGDATPASIQAQVDAFRAALGNPNNANNPGPISSGRREINWDGGGATTATSSGPTLTAFQNTRGATFTTPSPGTGFLQTPLDAMELTNINPTYSTTFGTFSPVRIFTPVGSNITDVTFSLPGTSGATPATVSGFGAVFTDVDLPNLTQLAFFDISGNPIGTPLSVTPGTVAAASLSFLGALANAGERIARVRITTGNRPLGPNDFPGDFQDVVTMDDFIYSEPLAIPEPSAMVLCLMAVAAASAWIDRRRI
jgi:hypothetical protein